jgi:hypothetical protein
MFLSDVGPFELPPKEKTAYLSGQLGELLAHHASHCPGYARLVDDWRDHHPRDEMLSDEYPYIPVTVFKEFDLRSTGEAVMSVNSSATTSNQSSKIFVDKATRKRQSLSANKILADFIGPQRRPYLVFDLESTVRGTQAMSARGAAIMSLAHMASEFHFVMREEEDQLRLDPQLLETALSAIGQQPFISYGFTYILYLVHQEMRELGLDLASHPDSVFLHSGGWKRLINLAVDKPTFNRGIAQLWGLPPENVIDFYGTVEQVGIPYPDCSAGLKHVPYWAEVVIRGSDSLAPVETGQTGLIQLINCLPLSAPNHSVLTEDLGELCLEDGCDCGRRGRAFVFRGRAPRSEIRGCSDVARR